MVAGQPAHSLEGGESCGKIAPERFVQTLIRKAKLGNAGKRDAIQGGVRRLFKEEEKTRTHYTNSTRPIRLQGRKGRRTGAKKKRDLSPPRVPKEHPYHKRGESTLKQYKSYRNKGTERLVEGKKSHQNKETRMIAKVSPKKKGEEPQEARKVREKRGGWRSSQLPPRNHRAAYQWKSTVQKIPAATNENEREKIGQGKKKSTNGVKNAFLSCAKKRRLFAAGKGEEGPKSGHQRLYIADTGQIVGESQIGETST